MHQVVQQDNNAKHTRKFSEGFEMAYSKSEVKPWSVTMLDKLKLFCGEEWEFNFIIEQPFITFRM